ncbi:MAG: undecaprenyl-diphosphate phosphatase [Clostridia bacterium]|nr:undecaprenyl-diphosphate phosphatase [Clostridia bacterium]
MSILQSIFLGLLQGFSEFLPISSSGHLILAQRLLDVEATLFFDVALHVGTLFAVIVVYKKSLATYVAKPLKNRRLHSLLLASAPTFVIAFAVKAFVPQGVFEGLLPVGFALTIALLVTSHYLYKPQTPLDKCPLWKVLLCGIVQGAAVFPGLSRSGSTVSTLKLCGLHQEDATEFSFVLSLPVIAGSALVEGLELLTKPLATPWYCVVIGVFFAFLSGYASLSVLKSLKSSSWVWFALYLPIPLVLSLICI